MIQRRSFLKATGLIAAAGFLSPNELIAKKVRTVGLQLYTLRERMAKDPEGTLAEVAKLGYKEVEGFGTSKGLFFGYAPEEFSKLLKRNNLKMVSSHVGYIDDKYKSGESNPTLTQDPEKLFNLANEAGVKYLVCPWLPNNLRTTDGYKQLAANLGIAGKKAKEFGIEIGYHNHEFEFDALEGTTGYDILLNNTKPDEVKFELDLCWAVKSKNNPVDLFKKHPGRFFAWHVKDLGTDGITAEVGSGTINFKEIFENAKLAGTKHFFVEQDKCPADPLLSIEKSIKYLNEKFRY